MSSPPAMGDLQALMAVIEDGRRDKPTGALPWAAIYGLSRLIRCDTVVFNGADRAQHRCLIQQQVDDGGDFLIEFDAKFPETEPYWRLYHSFRSCDYIDRTGDLASVIRWSDFYTPTELREAPLFAEYFGPNGCKHCISMTFPANCWRRRSLSLALIRDSGSDFTERDRLALQLLRPHLYELYLTSRRRGQDPVRLTSRENEVLQLAGDGYSNADIARNLVISVSTVRKHMEHIFDQTGVRTRTAAVAKLRTQRGLLDQY